MLASPNFVRFVYDGDGSDTPDGRSRRLGADRAGLPGLLRQPGSRDRADGVRRALGLRSVHRPRRTGRRPVLGRRGRQDAGAGGDLRRHRGCRVRPLLPPGVRRHRQPEPDVVRPARRRRGDRARDVRVHEEARDRDDEPQGEPAHRQAADGPRDVPRFQRPALTTAARSETDREGRFGAPLVRPAPPRRGAARRGSSGPRRRARSSMSRNAGRRPFRCWGRRTARRRPAC